MYSLQKIQLCRETSSKSSLSIKEVEKTIRHLVKNPETKQKERELHKDILRYTEKYKKDDALPPETMFNDIFGFHSGSI